jgi:hypothetical protein
MLRVMLIIIGALMFALPVQAQQAADYAIRNLSSRFSENNSIIVVDFEVQNLGGAATSPATIELTSNATGEEISVTAALINQDGEQLPIRTLRPLEAGEIVNLRLSFPASDFPAGSNQAFTITVGVGQVEQENADTVQNNAAILSITAIPGTSGAGTPPATTGTPGPTPTPTRRPEASPLDLLERLNIDTSNREQLALLVGVIGAALVLLVVLIVILRLLFQKPPKFDSWQPPYANMPYVDVNSMAGRRQQWQQYAQNDFPPPQPGAEGSAHARKLLFGMNGVKLNGWTIEAMRISQYDMYGRVARSQFIVPKGLVKRLDRLARKSPQLNRERVAKQARGVAQGILNPFVKKLNTRNAMLPIAFDIRLQGAHGEVRIIFELFVHQNGQWQQVDQWEPEMVVVGKAIQESFTYTLYGLLPNENLKTLKRRLVDDLTRMLSDMLKDPPPPPTMSQDTPRDMRPVSPDQPQNLPPH